MGNYKYFAIELEIFITKLQQEQRILHIATKLYKREEIILRKKRQCSTKEMEFIQNYEIVRLNIRDMKDGAVFNKTPKELNLDKITICSSEVVRIVTAFAPENVSMDGSKYPFIKDLIILKIGKSYKKYYEELCKNRTIEEDKGVFTLNVTFEDKDNSGNNKIESIRYKRLLCGSSFVRNCKELYIREELYNSVMEVLLTGISFKEMFPITKVAKFSTYLGLAATDSRPVSMPNICVVADYKKMIKDAFDIVIQEDLGDNSFKYKVQNYCDTHEETEEEINCFDGAGIVSYERACIWAKELGLSYVPSSFQIRVLNGIKGNLYTFPVTEFIEYLEKNGLQEKLKVTDLWGDIVDVKGKNNDVFLTESQFKFHNKYNSFAEWEESFLNPVKHNENEYCRTFNICDYSIDISKMKDKIWSAYQPLQTIELSNDDIRKITEPTREIVKKLHTDVNEFIKYRGISLECEESEQSNKRTNLTPWYYQALLLDDSLQYDKYIRKKIIDDLNGLKMRIYTGKILLDGNYQTAIPDLLALMEHIFGLEVKGALGKWEVYSNYWLNKNVDKISIWRNPHIACEWCNAKIVSNEKTKWFKYQTTGYVTDIYSTLALRLGTMDFDGDTVAGVSSDIIYNAVEKAKVRTIRVITKKQYVEENKGENKEFCISDTDKIMYTNYLGFQNNIGDVTNKVTKLWGAYGDAGDLGTKRKILDDIKIMSVINQLIVDFVKTGIKVPVPSDILEKLKNYKMPVFMQYKNGNWVNDKIIEANKNSFRYLIKDNINEDITIDEYVDNQKKYYMTNGTVDKICKYMQSCVSDIELDFESVEQECQFTKIMSDIEYIYNATYPKIINKLRELLEMHKKICGKKYYDDKSSSSMDDSSGRFERFYSYCEIELHKLCKNRNKLLNYLIYAYYTDKEFCNADKSILWNVFGKDICGHYLNGNVILDEKKLERLKKSEEKAQEKAEKVKEMCQSANIVHIHGLEDGEIIITKNELLEIDNNIDDSVARRLMIVLLALYKKLNINSEKNKCAIKLVRGKKGEITKNQLCKLANIHYNQFDKRLEKLVQSGLISVDISNLKVPKISLNMILDNDKDGHKISDINDVSDIS